MAAEASRETQLRERLKQLTRRERRIVGVRSFSLIVAFLIFAIAGVSYAVKHDLFLTGFIIAYGLVPPLAALGAPTLALFTLAFRSGPDKRDPEKMDVAVMSVRNLRDEIREIRDELDLLALSVESSQQRAEKLFRIHQNELKRYYDQTLAHSSRLFFVGLASLVVGFSLIGVTVYLVAFRFAHDAISAKIVVAALGGAAAVLSNFVGVVYVNMFRETLAQLTAFHSRLVLTHHVHFGNVLTAKIANEALRDHALASMAVVLAGSNLTDAIPRGSDGAIQIETPTAGH